MEETNIRLVKLANGTEILGKMVHLSKSGVTLEDPIQINYRSINSVMPLVSVTRYLQFADTRTIHFEPKDYLHVVGIVKGMERFYNYSLGNFQNVVDKLVDRELANAVSDEELAGGEVDKSELYKAFLEKITSDAPFN